MRHSKVPERRDMLFAHVPSLASRCATRHCEAQIRHDHWEDKQEEGLSKRERFAHDPHWHWRSMSLEVSDHFQDYSFHSFLNTLIHDGDDRAPTKTTAASTLENRILEFQSILAYCVRTRIDNDIMIKPGHDGFVFRYHIFHVAPPDAAPAHNCSFTALHIVIQLEECGHCILSHPLSISPR